ncbi:hypothetical protein BKA67DRAFT_38523 [Truncatella angustata]|uniref:Uncharacterized protein n=1 Tax=Truncatella angustata TaxID=152316 RepID=A0A9P8UXX8_9PEZI|nr:uncharacterized protein BKA67DRAFT_38523 [Truncatella angustata]KAH6660051.1 hypothetical protein BKA67DRAFT_38523 [Truncatella angustata]
MAKELSGPGSLYVESKIANPKILDETTYLKWYDEVHIPEIIQMTGIKSARRFKDINPDADKPYLAIYPLKDIAFLGSEEFKHYTIKSDLLPGTGDITELADFSNRIDSLIQVYDPTQRGTGHTRSIISAQIELKEEADAEEFDKWYREEHLGRVAGATGYLRTTRFKLNVARNISTTGESAAHAPAWLAIHEFAVESPDLLEIKKLAASPWTEKLLEGRKLSIFRVYKTMAEFGEEDWFHGHTA